MAHTLGQQGKKFADCKQTSTGLCVIFIRECEEKRNTLHGLRADVPSRPKDLAIRASGSDSGLSAFSTTCLCSLERGADNALCFFSGHGQTMHSLFWSWGAKLIHTIVSDARQ